MSFKFGVHLQFSTFSSIKFEELHVLSLPANVSLHYIHNVWITAMLSFHKYTHTAERLHCSRGRQWKEVWCFLKCCFNQTAQSFLWAADIHPSPPPSLNGSGKNYSWRNWCHEADGVNENANKKANNPSWNKIHRLWLFIWWTQIAGTDVAAVTPAMTSSFSYQKY